MSQPTHYEVLSLPANLSDLASPEQAIRQAYRRTLLRHHPDKANKAAKAAASSGFNNSASSTNTATPFTTTATTTTTASSLHPRTIYTVDQITAAYTTLSTPILRSEYDNHLRLTAAASKTQHNQARSTFQTGIETVDLDDLESFTTSSAAISTPSASAATALISAGDRADDDVEVEWWFRPCRCGNERGFLFSEADLEETGDLGELIVGCQDCSLWLRVCFAVLEEDEEDGEGIASNDPASMAKTNSESF
ncbi:hypothetical protein BD289DRAFT_478440 [Coniella lustricola]|uniref:Diphthamide biosynthesis protein 4 n=1 Tax=Coniella lustricola TaxID=2025994 RepID=A0A2T3AMG2_9PEZI|nr:hypothetical protein BD289DRAFT_478440 [Coniella lustricola]